MGVIRIKNREELARVKGTNEIIIGMVVVAGIRRPEGGIRQRRGVPLHRPLEVPRVPPRIHRRTIVRIRVACRASVHTPQEPPAIIR